MHSANEICLEWGRGASNITGGGDNMLTINVNGVGTASNAYSFTGDIVDTGASGFGTHKDWYGKTNFDRFTEHGNDADSVLNCMKEPSLWLRHPVRLIR